MNVYCHNRGKAHSNMRKSCLNPAVSPAVAGQPSKQCEPDSATIWFFCGVANAGGSGTTYRIFPAFDPERRQQGRGNGPT